MGSFPSLALYFLYVYVYLFGNFLCGLWEKPNVISPFRSMYFNIENTEVDGI